MRTVLKGHFFVMLLFCLFIDLSLTQFLSFYGARPIFSYLFVCYAIFEWTSAKAIWAAFFVGVFRDFFSIQIYGLETFVLLTTAIVFDFIVHKIEREFPGIYFLLAIGYIAAILFLTFLIESWIRSDFHHWSNAIDVIIYSAIYSGFFLPLFYQMAEWWFKDHPNLKQYELFT